MKLRDATAPLEGALTRARALPESVHPFVVVGPKPGTFIQYSGSATRRLVLGVCLNVETREIDGFEEAAKGFFGHEVRVHESETFGVWEKECESITRAVELGMQVLRHVLMLGWDTELFIEEGQDRTLSRAEFFGRGRGKNES